VDLRPTSAWMRIASLLNRAPEWRANRRLFSQRKKITEAGRGFLLLIGRRGSFLLSRSSTIHWWREQPKLAHRDARPTIDSQRHLPN